MKLSENMTAFCHYQKDGEGGGGGGGGVQFPPCVIALCEKSHMINKGGPFWVDVPPMEVTPPPGEHLAKETAFLRHNVDTSQTYREGLAASLYEPGASQFLRNEPAKAT